MPDDREAQVHQLAPLVRPDRPVPVEVLVEGEWHRGLVTSWRGDRVLAEFTVLGLKYLRWLPADQVRRVEGLLEEVEPTLVLYHRTDAGAAIVRDGFRDATGSYGLVDHELTGVFVADVPVDVNEGATGDDLLELLLPADVALDEFEIVEEMKPYREWCVPAQLLNTRARVRLLSEEEADEAQARGWDLR